MQIATDELMPLLCRSSQNSGRFHRPDK